MAPPDSLLRISESPPSRPPTKKYNLHHLDEIEDEDELSLVETSPYFTQATQIATGPPTLKREQPAARPALRPSSPIEVPASSPLPKPSPILPLRAGRLANAMAPAGTAFRSPAVHKSLQNPQPIYVPDSDDDEIAVPTYVDSSDDGQPSRGDIQPTSFKRKEPPTSSTVTTPAKSAKPLHVRQLADKRAQSLASKLYTILKGAFTLSDCENAVLDCAFDIDAAAASLYEQASDSAQSSQKSKSSLPSPGSLGMPRQTTQLVSLLSDSEDELAGSPKPKRRRLVKGLKRRPTPGSSPMKPSQTEAAAVSQVSQVIELLSDGDDDDFQGNASSPQSQGSEGEHAFEERMLSYLNNCDKVQLMAIANIKEPLAEAMLKHQPFDTLDAARAVSVPQKKAGKRGKALLGEDVVDALQEYARALDGIDHVIAVCEQQAARIKNATSVWKLDVTGSNRTEPGADDEQPMTPLSLAGSAQLIDLPIPQEPPQMRGHCTMKSYQLYGLNWMNLLYEKGFGGILADDMGLGKTCQVISLMCTIVDQWQSKGGDASNRPWPNLVVVPPSTLANWEGEFNKFAPGLSIISYRGSQAERDEIAEDIMENPEEYHVVLTTYSQLGRSEDIDNLRGIRPMVAVFDEGHKMKNPKTKQYRELIRIPATWRLLLTGTPVQNNLMEMISLLQFVEPELFRDHFDDLEALFNQKVSLAEVSKGALLFSERVGRARTILEPFILQRRKEQVLKSLPTKTSRVVLCDLDKNQNDLYKGFERRFRRTEDSQPNPKGRNNDNNNVWMQLRKSAIHPQLFRRAFDDDTVAQMAKILIRSVPQDELRQDNLQHLTNELLACSDFELHLWCRDYKCIRRFDLADKSWTQSAKVQKMLELVREYQKNGDRVLIFTRFAKVIELLAECLASEDFKYLALQGATDVGERQDLIDEFTHDPSITVFLLTTGAGGTGINLTAANKVIIFDQSDNPQDDVQAENRAHRLGQTRDVEVVKLVSKDTIEELVQKACEKKLELANKVTGWADSTPTMSSAEMETMVRQQLLAKDHTPSSSDSP